MGTKLKDQISDVVQEIYGYADSEFNVSSPSQLADILHTKLGLPTQFIKKTKTGYSTKHSELMKLKDLHPIIELILNYREWTKLKSTYVDTLPEQIDEDGRVHTTFDLDAAGTRPGPGAEAPPPVVPPARSACWRARCQPGVS